MSRRLLVTVFGNETDALAATRKAHEEGYDILDVYTPYAVHGLDRAMGLKPSRLPWVCFTFGLMGAAAKLWFQIWTSATNWPINVGGKPLESVPAFVPVTFEIMTLFAGLGTVAAFLLVSRLRPGKKPKVLYEKVTDDEFVLVLVEKDAAFDVQNVQEMFSPFHVVRIEERVEQEEQK